MMKRCFFSSRRRHTRYWRDWSSDVCSSDLLAIAKKVRHVDETIIGQRLHFVRVAAQLFYIGRQRLYVAELHSAGDAPQDRSEERRVGKECRSRWSSCP